MYSQKWIDIDDEAIMSALGNETDALLNLEDFFQEEIVEGHVQDHEDVVEDEPAEEIVEMELSAEDEDEEGFNAVDEGGAGEQGWVDVNLEDFLDIQMYHVSDSEDSDYESDSDSDYESDSDFDGTSDSEFEHGFRTHELNSDGVCTRCLVYIPQNQLCN